MTKTKWRALAAFAMVAAVPNLVAGAVLVWTLTQAPDTEIGDSSVEPLLVPVLFDEATAVIAGRLLLKEDGDPLVVLSGAASDPALVTSVLVAAGDSVSSGDVVLRADGIQLVALATPAPFYRFLAVGATGDDVRALKVAFSQVGFDVDLNVDQLTARDKAAIRAFQLLTGRSQREATGVFDPSSVLWLPVEPFQVTRVEVVAGAELSGPGVTILRGATPVAIRELTDADGLPIRISGAWTLSAMDHEFELVNGNLSETSAQLLAEVVDEFETDLDSAIDVRLTQVSPAERALVPSTAVLVRDSGALCIIRQVNGVFEAVDVTPVGAGTATATAVSREGLDVGDLVLANPLQTEWSPATCP